MIFSIRRSDWTTFVHILGSLLQELQYYSRTEKSPGPWDSTACLFKNLTSNYLQEFHGCYGLLRSWFHLTHRDGGAVVCPWLPGADAAHPAWQQRRLPFDCCWGATPHGRCPARSLRWMTLRVHYFYHKGPPWLAGPGFPSWKYPDSPSCTLLFCSQPRALQLGVLSHRWPQAGWSQSLGNGSGSWKHIHDWLGVGERWHRGGHPRPPTQWSSVLCGLGVVSRWWTLLPAGLLALVLQKSWIHGNWSYATQL